MKIGYALAAVALTTAALAAQSSRPGRLSMDGVTRAAAAVDSVFIDRTLPDASIDGGDWASYLLARLGAGQIPDNLGIEVMIDSAHIEVAGRLQDLPAETRQLLGPLAGMVDSSTVVVADVILQRTGKQVIRFWLRGIQVNGFPFPEFLLARMMASVGRQYPALTASGRDLYVQVPADGVVALGEGVVRISIAASDSSARRSAP